MSIKTKPPNPVIASFLVIASEAKQSPH